MENTSEGQNIICLEARRQVHCIEKQNKAWSSSSLENEDAFWHY